jgi:hypothetical protein
MDIRPMEYDWERARVASFCQPLGLGARRVYVASWETLCGGEWRHGGISGRACATADAAVMSLRRAIDRRMQRRIAEFRASI